MLVNIICVFQRLTFDWIKLSVCGNKLNWSAQGRAPINWPFDCDTDYYEPSMHHGRIRAETWRFRPKTQQRFVVSAGEIFLPPWKNVLDRLWNYSSLFKNLGPSENSSLPRCPKLVTGLGKWQVKSSVKASRVALQVRIGRIRCWSLVLLSVLDLQEGVLSKDAI